MAIDWGLLADRALWLALGLIIGTAFGWAWRAHREVHHVEEVLAEHGIDEDHPGPYLSDGKARKRPPPRDEEGFLSPRATTIGMAIVILLTVYAAFQSQATSNQVISQQQTVEDSNVCTQRIVGDIVAALDGRTQFSAAQAQANLELQRAQATYLRSATRPETTETERAELTTRYANALAVYLATVTRVKDDQTAYPFPEPDRYHRCLLEAQTRGDN